MAVCQLIGVVDTGDGGGQSHNVDAVPHLVGPDAIDRFFLRDAVAATQPSHAVNFRKRAGDDQIRVVLD